MRIASGFIASLALMASACHTPQVSPSASAQAQSECARLAEGAGALNAMALFEAAGVCAAEDREEDANYLMMVAQIRAMTDIGTLTPADMRDPKVVEFAGALYSGMGGLGFVEVYRDPAAVDRLAARVEAAPVVFVSGYDPGWVYKPAAKTDIYDVIALNAKQQRVWQMRNYALLIQDDAYYEAQQALDALRSQHQGLTQGTPEFEEYERLSALMAAAADSVAQLPQPESTLPYDRLNEPEADGDFRQIATGANGPADYNVELFASREAAAASWLSRAYAPTDLAALLDSINFGEDVLAAYSVGQRMNASGRITIYSLEYDRILEGYSISIRVGVLPESCGAPATASYPYVLGTVSKGETIDVRGTSMSNFPDACGPAASGQPSN